jgi:hypothetical protein
VRENQSDVCDQPPAAVPGMCSNPEPTDLRDLQLGHRHYAWYLLAEAEIAAGIDVSITSKLRDRLGGRSWSLVSGKCGYFTPCARLTPKPLWRWNLPANRRVRRRGTAPTR